MMDANMRAMLALISFSEGTDRAADPYRVCFGYRHTIRVLNDHPAVTGEWKGEKLPDAMCRAAGFGPGCVSTAAGRYQLIKPTWLRARTALQLPDFGPASQDQACAWLISTQGAGPDVLAGRIEQAIVKVRRIWASLPGAGWEQHERRLPELLAAYGRAGGRFA
jgi:muramidase (phage lysozyme)